MMGDLPGRLDRMVHKAGLDVLTPYGAPRRRNLRWLPLVILLALPAGYGLLLFSLHRIETAGMRAFWLGLAGSALFFLAFGAAQLIRLFGPRVGWEGGALDERELILKARAGSIAGSIVAALCALGCFYGGYAAVFGAWMPASAVEWVYLGLIIEAYALTLPVLVASWLQPPPDEEE
jgi:hypothetical protein